MAATTEQFKAVSKNRLHEEIIRQIESKIIAGEFQIGDKLPGERELALFMKVNRGTVREALKKLEILGLVEIRHGEGIYVKNYLESGNLELLKDLLYLDASIDIDLLGNLLEIRRILVPEMAANAAKLRSDAELAAIELIVENLSGMSILEQDLQIHRVIARASHNTCYMFILNFFNQLFQDYGHLYFDTERNRKKSHEFHLAILKALQERKSDDARRIMKEVLEYTEKEIYKRLKEMGGYHV